MVAVAALDAEWKEILESMERNCWIADNERNMIEFIVEKMRQATGTGRTAASAPCQVEEQRVH